jgi:hypothetical protein
VGTRHASPFSRETQWREHSGVDFNHSDVFCRLGLVATIKVRNLMFIVSIVLVNISTYIF